MMLDSTISDTRYAEVAVYQAPLRRTFHYAIPDGWNVSIGQLVDVSFRTGRSQGIVIWIDDHSPVAHPKPLLGVLVDEPVVTPAQIALAQWLAAETASSLSACLWLMLPPGLAKRGDMQYTLIDETYSDHDDVTAALTELLRARGTLRAAQIDRVLPKSGWREHAQHLISRGVLRREAVLAAPDAHVQTIRLARLAIEASTLESAYETLTRSPKQASILRYLAAQSDPQVVNEVLAASDAGNDALNRLVEKGFVAVEEIEHLRDPLEGRQFTAGEIPILTAGQQAVWDRIRERLEIGAQADVFLLHGVTGSGKTEVYLRALELTLAQGRQAIVLVPEISLVPQTVQRFASRFPGRVAVIHSSLTDGEQYDTWRRARAGAFDVVVGARSALFTPLADVGLVIIDEEHDDSYKQSPPLPPPYYHAREAAIAMMQINHGHVILGSATPSVTTAYHARQGTIVHLKMPNRVLIPDTPTSAHLTGLPPVEIVDMRQELRAGNRSMFSRSLRHQLTATLQRGEQAMLFLNRRGSATFVLCRDCGYVARCPRCEMTLTYHQAGAALVCHSCGYTQPQSELCPNCGSQRIRYFGAGTATVEEAVIKEFAPARVLRWDRDTTQARGAHEQLLERFATGEADVLVGTQMIVKGLDLPRVTLVGVVLADTALGLPDYRSGERTFQLLTQAAGRAGRSNLPSQVIFQTYQPEHYAIQAASTHDYETFFEQELHYRRDLGYPPYRRLVRFSFRDTNALKAQQEAEHATELLRQHIKQHNMTVTDLIGPAPAFFGKMEDTYTWHLIVRTTDLTRLLTDLSVRNSWIIDVDPTSLL
ncbi:MAG: primosomal protein N' [Anaerolineae bacterium]